MLKEILSIVNHPLSRTWWVAILSAMLIAILYKVVKEGKFNRQTLIAGLLFHVILHPSSIVDLQLIVVRCLMRVGAVIFFPLTAHFVAVKTILYTYKHVGDPPLFLEGKTLVVTYSLTLLILSDLVKYLAHVCMHRIGILWRFHQVHHSASVMTPFTLHRVHPVELILNTFRDSLVYGVTAGLFAWLSFGKASVWMLYGVPGFLFIFVMLGANLRHSHIKLSYPKWLERILISPAQHQIHHSISRDHQNSNYGSILALWDYLYGSLKFSKDTEQKPFGVEHKDLNHDPTRIRSVLLDPLKIKTPSTKAHKELV